MTKIEGAGPHSLIPEALNNELINSFKEMGVIHNGPLKNLNLLIWNSQSRISNIKKLMAEPTGKIRRTSSEACTLL